MLDAALLKNKHNFAHTNIYLLRVFMLFRMFFFRFLIQLSHLAVK